MECTCQASMTLASAMNFYDRISGALSLNIYAP
jgi:hypothetical protein